MKLQLTIFVLAVTLIHIAKSYPHLKSSSSSSSSAADDDEISDVVEELLKACKAKGCKKEDILKEMQTAIDNYMKSVKPAELNRDETLKDIDTLAKALGENEIIKGSEVKEFLLGLMKKYDDKFGAVGATTKKTK